jgi:hypothetical protein
MSHYWDYCKAVLAEAAKKDINTDYLPLALTLMTLWDVWDFVMWPIRRLRIAFSHWEAKQ